MKIVCQKCTAQYEVQESAIPPSGGMMRCPACLHTFPVKPGQAGTPQALELLGHTHEEEFTPPGARPFKPGPLPLAEAVVSPVSPVRASTHEGSQEAELPVPKRAARADHPFGGRPGAFEPPRRTEAPDLPAPKRPAPRPMVPLPPVREDAAPVLIPPAPTNAPAVALPGTSGPQRRISANQADLPAPVGPHGRNLPDLPAPVGPTSRHADLPAPRNLPMRPVTPPASVPVELDLELEGDRTADLPAPVKAELVAPVKAELMAPVKAELVSPVEPSLPSPIPDLPPAPVPARKSSASSPDDALSLELDGGSQDSLGIKLGDLPPPPPRAQVVPTLDTLGAWPPRPGATVLAEGPGLDLEGPPPRPQPVSGRRPAPVPEKKAAPAAPAGLLQDDDLADQLTQPILPEDELPPLPPEEAQAEGAAGEGAAAREGAPDALLSEEPDELASAASPVLTEVKEEKKEEQKPQRSRRRTALLFAGAAILLLLLGGAGVYVFVLNPSLSSADQAAMDQARKLLLEESMPSYRKAAERLHEIAVRNKGKEAILGLEAQARLCAARYGVSAEQRTAEERISQVPPGSQEPEVLKARGLHELVANKLPEARRLLERARTSKDPLVPVYLGWVDMQSGKYPTAEKDFAAALRIDAKAVTALYGTAQIKEKTGDAEGAFAAYGQVLELKKDHFGAVFGQIRTDPDGPDESKLLEAIANNKATASSREQAEAWTQLATWAMDHSEQKEAEERLHKAVAADPSLSTAQVGLARIECEQEKYAEAAELAGKVFKAEPANVEAGLTLVRALLGQKKPLDAGTPLAALAKVAPKDARVYYWQGRREEDVAAPDSDEKAAASYHKALELDGKYLDAYIALSRVLSRQGKATDALAALKQAAAQAEGDPELANALGEAHLAAGDASKAEEAFRLALQKKDDFTKARMNLALALEQRGALEGAERQLAKVQEQDPNYPGLTERRAWVLLKQGRYDEAGKLYLQAAAQPGASERLRLDAVQYTMKDHPDEAAALAEAVAREDTRSARAHGLLADLRLQQNQLPEAAMQIEQAFRMGDSPEIELTRGRVLLAQNRRPEGLAALAAARKPPIEGMAMGLHARQLLQQGQVQESLKEVSDLIERQKALFADRAVYRPDEVAAILGDAYLLLGDLQGRSQNDTEALRAFENACRELPRSGNAAFQYGRSLYLNGKKPQAIQEELRAVELGGDTAPYALEAYLLLGDSYRERRQRAEAVRAYKKWLSLASPSAPERHEVDRSLRSLGEIVK